MTTSRFRRLASAACLVAGPALLAAAAATLPWVADESAEETVATAAENATATNIGDIFMFLAILVTVPAMLAVGRVLRRDAPLLSLLGSAAAVAGLIGAMLVVVTDQVNVAVGGSDIPRDQLADAFDGGSAWALFVVLAVFLAGFTVGTILLGSGLVRTRVVPAWAGWAVVAWPVLGLVAHTVGMKGLDVAGALVGVAGFWAVARLVAATGDEQWERGEIAAAERPAGDAVAA